jgi:hypothetical protein
VERMASRGCRLSYALLTIGCLQAQCSRSAEDERQMGTLLKRCRSSQLCLRQPLLASWILSTAC